MLTLFVEIIDDVNRFGKCLPPRTVVGRLLRIEVVYPKVVVDLAVRVGVAGAGGVVERLPVPLKRSAKSDESDVTKQTYKPPADGQRETPQAELKGAW